MIFIVTKNSSQEIGKRSVSLPDSILKYACQYNMLEHLRQPAADLIFGCPFSYCKAEIILPIHPFGVMRESFLGFRVEISIPNASTRKEVSNARENPFGLLEAIVASGCSLACPQRSRRSSCVRSSLHTTGCSPSRLLGDSPASQRSGRSL